MIFALKPIKSDTYRVCKLPNYRDLMSREIQKELFFSFENLRTSPVENKTLEYCYKDIGCLSVILPLPSTDSLLLR